MDKARRRGKVLVDWSQNSPSKTTVAVYSMRGKRDRPFVSMPVTWEELKKLVRTRKTSALFFSPADALRRLKRKGDLFAPVLTLKQSLPKAFAKLLYGVTELGTPVTITDDEQVRRAAERERRAAEYQSAMEEIARTKAGLQADAERVLAEFERAKAAHEETMRQHNSKMAKYHSDVASE
jgi:hypothetical protein